MADDSSRPSYGTRAGLAPGAAVAGYRIEEPIGAGGMAVVYRARDERLGRPVALKVLAPSLADDQEFRARFIREWRAATSVEHPHIIPVYGADEADGVLYIAMRLVNGGDVASLVRRAGPLTPDLAAGLISAVASALDAAHQVGLVHRDIKPGNMLLDSAPGLPDHVYLSDFGLTKNVVTGTALTSTGTFMGTPDYVSPEQIAGKGVDGRADQYALACVAVYLLTGRPPYTRPEQMALLWAHMSDPAPSITAVRPELSPAVDPVIARGMAKSPEERYGSCGELATALRRALAGHASPPPPPASGIMTERPLPPAPFPASAGNGGTVRSGVADLVSDRHQPVPADPPPRPAQPLVTQRAAQQPPVNRTAGKAGVESAVRTWISEIPVRAVAIGAGVVVILIILILTTH